MRGRGRGGVGRRARIAVTGGAGGARRRSAGSPGRWVAGRPPSASVAPPPAGIGTSALQPSGAPSPAPSRSLQRRTSPSSPQASVPARHPCVGEKALKLDGGRRHGRI